MNTYKLIRDGVAHDRPTRGALNINGEIFATLERPWLNNKPYISCIPEGKYEVKWHNSPSKGWCWKLLNVSDRTNILIHVGNMEDDTEGCILVGERHDRWQRIDDDTGSQYDIPVVVQSRAALARMTELLGENNWQIEVVNNG